MKKLFAAFFCMAFLFSVSSMAAKSQTQQTSSGQVKHKKTIKASKKYKVRKYVTPPIDELRVDDIPTALPIPQEVATLLSKNDIEGAIRILRIEPPSLRTLNLLREAQRIEAYKKDKKVTKIEPHKFYQNLGIAYHNLYLYLKRNGLENPELVKSAIKFYKKAGKSLAISEQTESKLLEASILAVSGNSNESDKIFSGLDITTIEEKDTGRAYLAGYYAATGDAAKVIEELNAAYDIGGEHISMWVRISDDFFMLENDDNFHAMLNDWTKRDKQAKLEREKAARAEADPIKKKKSKKKKSSAGKKTKPAAKK